MTIKDKRICIGRIAAPHGVKGLVKVLPFCEDPALLELAAEFDLTLKNPSGKYILAAIKGIQSREEVEAIQGTDLTIAREQLPEADDGEYYYEDLVGLRAVDENGAEIGKVIAVHNYGAGDLLEIKPLAGDAFLMPFNEDTVISVEDVVHIKNHENFI